MRLKLCVYPKTLGGGELRGGDHGGYPYSLGFLRPLRPRCWPDLGVGQLFLPLSAQLWASFSTSQSRGFLIREMENVMVLL